MADQAQDAGATSPSNNVSKLDDERGGAESAPTKVASLEKKRAENPPWKKNLARTASGQIRKILLNGLVALRQAPEWRGALKYDASALTVVLDRCPPWGEGGSPWVPRLWTDQDDRLLAAWLQHHGIDISDKLASDAAQTVARERSYHPIRDYLNGLTWDGAARVSTWLSAYLGADKNPYHNEIGKRWLVSGIARIYKPAIKADCMLILEGQQGSGKSTALKVLGGEWFTDEIGELGSKDAAMSIAGRWIIEFGELEEFKGASLEKLKAFLSRTIDRFRPPYGRSVVDSPRQCIFAGTTNPEEYLHDSTGNRRFWPVKCGSIDVASLMQDRDQLWAEAKAMYLRGEPWWLETKSLQALATAAQNDRFVVDPWEEQAEIFLQNKRVITVAYLLKRLWKIDLNLATRKDTVRVAAILRRLGWERFQKRKMGRQIRAFRKKTEVVR